MSDRKLRLVQASPEEGSNAGLFDDMLRGYARMLLASGRTQTSVKRALLDVRRLVTFTDCWPWDWTTAQVDEWGADMVARGLALSTIRHRQGAIRRFCDFLTNPSYEWSERTLEATGSQVRQVAFEWNTTRHIEELEGSPERRPLNRDELKALFGAADDRVEALLSTNHKSALLAWRDSTLLKVHYGAGLRSHELVMLATADLLPHPAAPAFGRYAVVRVRFGKRKRGGPFQQRGVQMVMDWVVDALRQYVEEVHPALQSGKHLWPSERRDASGRQQPITTRTYGEMFASRRAEAGLDPALTPHCLRHSWQSHMAERGRDPLWRQNQAGHKHQSTTSIYTHVGGDHMNREMAAAIADLTTKDD